MPDLVTVYSSSMICYTTVKIFRTIDQYVPNKTTIPFERSPNMFISLDQFAPIYDQKKEGFD